MHLPLSFIPASQSWPNSLPRDRAGRELKHDGYRLQIHVRDSRVRLYTINGNDWTKRYPRILEEAARLRAPLKNPNAPAATQALDGTF